MRAVRLFFYFVIGLLLSSVAVLALAETIPAENGYGPWNFRDVLYSTPEPACLAAQAFTYGQALSVSAAVSGSSAVCTNGTGWTYTVYRQTNVKPCPTGQNWTLSGSNCTRPDCVDPLARDPLDGVCKVPPNKCAPKKDEWSDGWVSVPAGAAMPVGVVCLDGCEANRVLSVGGPDDGMGLGKGVDWWPIGQTFTGAVCSGVDIPLPLGTDPAKVPPKPAKKPVCAAGEGVMTSSSGKVLCVPEGVPGVSKPVVRKSEEVQTFPDGSTKKTTTTTTTDPNTGAKDVQTTAVSSGGQAGTAGTTTTNGGSSSDGDGDGDSDGDCDPTLNFCGGPDTTGLYEKKDKTVSSTLSTFADSVKGSAVGSAMSGFFTVSNHSGGCPAWVVNVAYLSVTVDIGQYFCTGTAMMMMDLVGAVLLAVASFVGFRWAVL